MTAGRGLSPWQLLSLANGDPLGALGGGWCLVLLVLCRCFPNPWGGSSNQLDYDGSIRLQ